MNDVGQTSISIIAVVQEYQHSCNSKTAWQNQHASSDVIVVAVKQQDQNGCCIVAIGMRAVQQ